MSLVEYPPAAVPGITFDRLNEHYREVVALARLVLRHWSFETCRGAVRAPGFLIDMNRVFQDFVTRALREELAVSERVLQSDDRINDVHLDDARHVRLQPDLAWWDGARYTFVADAKYKRTESGSAPNADLYQLLAYATALDLPGGLLIYAEGKQPPTHRVRHSGKLLGTHALDLSGTTDELIEGIAALARRVRALRAETWVNRAA